MNLIYIIAWVGLGIIANINGIIRTYWYGKYVSEPAAHQISTASAFMLFALYIWSLHRVFPFQSADQALEVGLVWLGMTVVFEFLFGHYVIKHSWRKLFHDYNILRGRLWLLILVEIALGPYVVFTLFE